MGYEDKRDYIAPVPVRDVRDSTGAGDAFAAGFVAASLRGLDPAVAGRIGSATAVLTMRHLGARTGLPTWGEALSEAELRYGLGLHES